MSKLGCSCGHVISDVAVPNEVTGSLISDRDEGRFFDFLDNVAADLVSHIKDGEIDAWRARHQSTDYPSRVPTGEMLSQIVQSRFLELTLSLMECDACGRLYVQRARDSNSYAGYQPDPDESGVPHVLGPVSATAQTGRES